ncbi:MAG: [Fe-Fe] hydrogenase large subunit C-terminal domain-containing protein [Bacteroidales bacterium]
MNNKIDDNIYHAIYIDSNICTGCTRCLKVCPTRAIRIRNGVATIDNRRCIDCGDCYRVCLVKAVKIEQGNIDSIFKYKYRVALIPTVLTGQFALDVSTDKIYKALLSIGFTHVYEEEQSVDFQIEAIKRFQKETDTNPIISTFCPAIVRLIQVRFPMLVDNLVLIKSLIDITAMTILDDFKKKGVDEKDIGIFYITPCSAKMVAVYSPVGGYNSCITDTINLDLIYNLISKELITIDKKDIELESRINLDASDILWSITGGEAKYASGRSLSIDGIDNVTEFLDKVDNEAIDDIDFLELRACDQGCPGGVLCPSNRFLTVEKMGMRANSTYEGTTKLYKKPIITHKYEEIQVNPVKPRKHLGLDGDLSVALKKMEKIHKYTCFLPGFDCGACGAPDCHSFARDVVNKEAQLSNCVFMQVSTGTIDKKHGKKLIENIWGKNRLEKDCNKKGVQE